MAKTSEPEEFTKTASVETLLNELAEELAELYKFRDYFFENHSLQMASIKNDLITTKINTLAAKFDEIDENDIPTESRGRYLYMKGRMFNISTQYDARATQCLSKAVKLNPHMVNAWNELGECYWKNLNIKDAKSSFEGALKQERNRIALRSLSIIMRQEATHAANSLSDHKAAILKSVELAKEAVSQDVKDGVSWSVLGNAHLCRYFLLAQEPATLKACMSAYKQAALDPIARGQPDLYYNYGVALKYDEQFPEALESFERACQLDPPWSVPQLEQKKLEEFLMKVNDLVRTKGKIKTKKIAVMVQSIDKKYLGPYGDKGNLLLMRLGDLVEGPNDGVVVLGKVVGSVYSENLVPFTFAMVDESMCCVAVTVYNWADGRGVIIGDTVALPRPVLRTHTVHKQQVQFRSIRIYNPMLLLVNGKKVGRNQFAGTRVTSTYEIP